MVTRTPRRRRQWQDFLVTADVADSAQANANLLDGVITETKGLTAVRFIIRLDLRPSTWVSNSTDSQMVTMGIGIFTADAISGSVYPDPNVSTDHPGAGWLWRYCTLVNEDQASGPARIDVDLRSMRKVMYGGTRLVINNDPDVGTAFTVSVRGLIRILYLLP